MLKKLRNRKVLMNLIQKCLMLLLVVIISAIGNNIYLIIKTNNNFNKKSSIDLNYCTSYIDEQINTFYQSIYSFRDNSDIDYFSRINNVIFSTQQIRQINNIKNNIRQTMVSNKSISDIFIGFNNIDLVVNKDGTMSYSTFDKIYNASPLLYPTNKVELQNKFSINQSISNGEIHTNINKAFHLYYYKTSKYIIIVKANTDVINKQLALLTATQNAYFVISNQKGDIYATNTTNVSAPSFNKLNSSKYQKKSDIISTHDLISTVFFNKNELHSNLLNINVVSITLCVLLISIIAWILYSLKCSLYDPLEELISKNANFFNTTVINEYELLEESINKYSIIAKEYENYRKDADYELEVNTLNRLLSNATTANCEVALNLENHTSSLYCILSLDLESAQGVKDFNAHTTVENILKNKYHMISILSMTYSNAYIIYLTKESNDYCELIDSMRNILSEHLSHFNICGISEVFDDINDAKLAYSQAQKALVSFNSAHSDHYISIYTLQRSKKLSLPNTVEIQNKIINNTLSLNYTEVEVAFNELEDVTLNLSINQKRKCFLQLYDYLCIFLANKDINANEFFIDDSINIEEIILNTLNTNLLLKTLLSCYQRSIFSASDGKNNDLLSLITKFIDDNIDKNISLLQLADEMNLSYTYMSKYFKEKMHISFVEYVQIKKIKSSQVLLQTTDLNIVDIAEKMGFNTANTFFRTFKKVTGVTPNEYRQQ